MCVCVSVCVSVRVWVCVCVSKCVLVSVWDCISVHVCFYILYPFYFFLLLSTFIQEFYSFSKRYLLRILPFDIVSCFCFLTFQAIQITLDLHEWLPFFFLLCLFIFLYFSFLQSALTFFFTFLFFFFFSRWYFIDSFLFSFLNISSDSFHVTIYAPSFNIFSCSIFQVHSDKEYSIFTHFIDTTSILPGFTWIFVMQQ